MGVTETMFFWAVIKRINHIHGKALPPNPYSPMMHDTVVSNANEVVYSWPVIFVPQPCSLDAFMIFVYINPQRTKLHFILFARETQQRKVQETQMFP